LEHTRCVNSSRGTFVEVKTDLIAIPCFQLISGSLKIQITENLKI